MAVGRSGVLPAVSGLLGVSLENCTAGVNILLQDLISFLNQGFDVFPHKGGGSLNSFPTRK